MELFFELIRVSIGKAECLSRTPSDDEWMQLFDMAQKQALLGVCFVGVKKLEKQGQQAPTALYHQWLAMTATFQQRNEEMNRHCAEVSKLLQEAGFRNFMMKGQGNARLYSVHGSKDELKSEIELGMLRQPGDIDLYLEGGRKKIVEYVQRTCPTKEVSELEIQYHAIEGVDVELHYYPFLLDNPRKNAVLNRFFEEQYEACYKNKVCLTEGKEMVAVPTLTFNLVHQMVHIFHHFFTEGVGMRQLMDYYFLMTSGQSMRADEAIRELHMERFASALMWVMGYVFQLEENRMPWKPSEKNGRILLAEVMRTGNFGKEDERTQGIYTNKWKSFWFVHSKTIRLWRFDHWAWLWSPLWRIYHFGWRKINRYR